MPVHYAKQQNLHMKLFVLTVWRAETASTGLNSD